MFFIFEKSSSSPVHSPPGMNEKRSNGSSIKFVIKELFMKHIVSGPKSMDNKDKTSEFPEFGNTGKESIFKTSKKDQTPDITHVKWRGVQSSFNLKSETP